jgi:tetratricopeptide (TPR) repeat protein
MTMRNLICALCLSIAAFACYGSARAQEVKKVKVHVADSNNEAIEGIVLSHMDIGSASPPTDDSGLTQVDLPENVQPDSWLFLQLVSGHGRNQDYILIDGQQKMPSKGSLDSTVRIHLIKKPPKDTPNRLNSTLTEEPRRDDLGDAEKLNKSAANELAKQENKKKADEGAEKAIRLGRSLYSQGKYLEAADAYKIGLLLHPDDPTIIDELGLSLVSAQDYRAAEPIYRRALAIKENTLGPDHLDVATISVTLASLCYSLGKDLEAVLLYKRALDIRDRKLGPEHPDVFGLLEIYVILLRKTHQENEVTTVEVRIKAFRAKYPRQDSKQ